MAEAATISCTGCIQDLIAVAPHEMQQSVLEISAVQPGFLEACPSVIWGSQLIHQRYDIVL